MRRLLRLLSVAITLALLVGCGGNGVGHPTLAELAGTYSGTWSNGHSGQSGSTTFTVNSLGAVSGTITNTALGSGNLFSSKASQGGHFEINGQYPSGSIFLIQNFAGHLDLDSAGNLSGILKEDKGDFEDSVTFNLTRQ